MTSNPTDAEIKTAIANYLENRVGIDANELGPSAALFTSGLLDSMEAVNLILFLKDELGVSVDPLAVGFQELDTMDRIFELCRSSMK